MRIRDIRSIGLSGATPEGGWSNEIKPEESVHTLVIVETDEGVTGAGSVFTNAGLVAAALKVQKVFPSNLIHLVASGDQTNVTVLDAKGTRDNSATAQRLLSVLKDTMS